MMNKKGMKLLICALVTMTMLFSFAACSSDETVESTVVESNSEASTTTSEDAQNTEATSEMPEYTILLNSGDKLSEFAQTFVAGCQQAISEITDMKIIGINEASETADVVENVSIIEQAVAQGYDGIISMPYSGDAFEEAYLSAWEKGVPTVAWHVAPVDGTVAISYCGPDPEAYTRAAVNFTVEKLEALGLSGEAIQIVVMTPGMDDQSAKQGEWAQEECEALGVTYVGNYTVGIEPAAQMETISGILQGKPETNGFIGFTATAGNSAAKVLEENGLSATSVVVGIDCTPSNCQDVKDGKVAGLIDQGAYWSGYNAVMILADWFRNGELTEYTNVQMNPTKIATIDDMDTYDAINANVKALVEALGQ